ncbi:hypothetical protein TNCV_3283671 [Trichonephila clavipes]|nr:hypothetical protein TNCV_3283671 [Trichonephila clavipes]
MSRKLFSSKNPLHSKRLLLSLRLGQLFGFVFFDLGITFYRFFAMLPVLGKKAVLEWCMEEGLIISSYVCPKCGKSMGKKERVRK